MSDGRLSPSTRDLIDLAKSDGPSAAARAKIWSGLSGIVGGAAAGGATGVGGGTTTSGLSAAKLLTLGTLLGGPLTVGLAVTLLHLAVATEGPASPVRPPAMTRPSRPVAAGAVVRASFDPTPWAPVAGPAVGAARAEPVMSALRARTRPVAAAAHRRSPKSLPAAPGAAGQAASAPEPHSTAPSDALAREASLVAEARDAIVRGDPTEALRDIAAARKLAAPQLVPEELAVEADALRALGRIDEAEANETILKSLYADSALAR